MSEIPNGQTKRIPPHRIERIRVLYLAGRSDAQIQDTLSREFACSCRQIRRYLRIMRLRFEKEASDDREAVKARSNGILLETLEMARAIGDVKTMATVAKHLAELGGVFVKRHEVTGPNGGPLQSESIARVVMMPPLDAEPAADATPGDPVEPAPRTSD